MIKKFLDLIFPSHIYCICCENLIDETRAYALCDVCMEEIEWADGSTCEICGKLMGQDAEDDQNSVCSDCEGTEHYFDRGFTCMIYGQRERQMIRRYKFKGAAYMGEKLGELMADRIVPEGLPVDMVMAVPMQPEKRRQRGYNQAELLAKVVSGKLGVPYVSDVLIRKSYKVAMNKLNAAERKENVIGTYDMAEHRERSNIEGKTILLVDDIYTTGSTVDECSRLLKSGGAELVYVFTLASGKDR